MGNVLRTKRAIVALLSTEKRTMTELCGMLGLAPSTVSQHLKELESIGAVYMVQNAHIKKWKHYRATPGYVLDGPRAGGIEVPYIKAVA